MKKANKAVAIATIGAAGLLALGACSSNTNQSQESVSPSATASTLSDSDRAAAGANHKGFVTSPAATGKYSKVVVTHNSAAKCSQSQNNDYLLIECSDVGHNAFGDAVYVRVPSKAWKFEVDNLSYDNGSGMQTTQRDHAASAYAHQNPRRDQYWTAPDLWTANSGWGVGVESVSNSEPIKVKIYVMLDD